MELVLALSMKMKPLTTGLICDKGGYMVDAVVQALNAVRLHGHAQLLASYDATNSSWMNQQIERAKGEILAMALVGEAFDFDVKVIVDNDNKQARRIDIRLKGKTR